MAVSQFIDLVPQYGLVRYHAKKWHLLLCFNGIDTIEVEDLRQVGFEGLLMAKNSYDPDKGASLSTHASMRIDGAIKDYLRKQDPLSQGGRKKVKELNQAREAFIKTSLREPKVPDLAMALGISEESVMKRQALQVFVLSLDAAKDPEDHVLWSPPSSEPSPEQETISADLREKLAGDVADCLQKALTDQQRRILIYRIKEELILELVGRLENISRATAQRREVEAKSKMRQCLDNKGWQVADIIEVLP